MNCHKFYKVQWQQNNHQAEGVSGMGTAGVMTTSYTPKKRKEEDYEQTIYDFNRSVGYVSNGGLCGLWYLALLQQYAKL